MTKKNNMKLDTKGFEYRGIMVDAMVERFGQETTITLIEHDGIRGIINNAAQAAANATTASAAGTIAALTIAAVVNTLQEVAA